MPNNTTQRVTACPYNVHLHLGIDGPFQKKEGHIQTLNLLKMIIKVGYFKAQHLLTPRALAQLPCWLDVLGTDPQKS